MSLISAVFLDLDGTLLDSNHKISQRSKNILRVLSERGIIIGIATGRSTQNIAKYILQLNLPQDRVPVIGYNGAMGFFYRYRSSDSTSTKEDDLLSKEVVFSCPLQEDSTRRLLDFAERHGCVTQYYDGATGEVLAVPKNDHHRFLLHKYETVVENPQIFLSSYDEIIKKCLSPKILIMTEKVDELIEAAYKELSIDEYTVIKGSPDPFFVEFLRSDVTKGEGVRRMCDKLEIHTSSIIAFGDGENDKEMLQLAGLGCAMKNARAITKESANHVLELTNDEEGVAKYLEDLLEQGRFLFK